MLYYLCIFKTKKVRELVTGKIIYFQPCIEKSGRPRRFENHPVIERSNSKRLPNNIHIEDSLQMTN